MKSMPLLACTVVLCAATAFAATTSTGVTASPPSTAPLKPLKPLTAQQERMKSCNSEAGSKSLTGGARKTFMSSCLKSS